MFSIDRAARADLEGILALANWAADNTTANFATSPESLDDWTASYDGTHQRYPWLVARESDRIVGFAKASPHRARGAYAWTAEVSVYVHPESHRRGVGRALYARLIPTLRDQGYVTLLAGITTSNPVSQRLHEVAGFVRCGTLRRAGWKFGQWHDVGWWELQLRDGAPKPLRCVADVWLDASSP